MRLSDLVGADASVTFDASLVDVDGITADSRSVTPGTVFVALAGVRSDGHAFIGDAIARGAAAIVIGLSDPLPDGVAPDTPVLRTAEPRRALAMMASRLYPRQPAHVCAITGTSGKTSVAEFTRQIFQHLGHVAAAIGTLGVTRAGHASTASLTTPDPVSLHRTLDDLARDGVTHVAMEASSHGLDQFRLDGVRVQAAAFLNLGRDHLDYHPTVAHYLDAKLRLFREVAPASAVAVVDTDGASSEAAVTAARARGMRVTTTGRAGDTLRLAGVDRDGFGQRVRIEHAGREAEIRLGLIGDYQASNVLVASALAMALGADWPAIAGILPRLTTVRGRLDIVGRHKGGLIVVDYAHKPDALAAALAALRPFATGRLISVFGCGGDRDAGKRPIMGGISATGADVTIVTDDNPRSEEPAAIRAAILAGVGAAAGAAGAIEIGDRADAIRAGVAMIRPGDVLLIAGKGHEDGQTIGGVTLPFSDHAVASAAMTLAATTGGPA